MNTPHEDALEKLSDLMAYADICWTRINRNELTATQVSKLEETIHEMIEMLPEMYVLVNEENTKEEELEAINRENAGFNQI